MGKVTVVTKSEAESRSAARAAGTAEAYKAAKYPVDKFPYFPTDSESLELFHIQLGPDAEVEPHAHTGDEIIYLLRGAIHLGARVLGPGDALFVAGNTLYGFKVGPEGVEFLNFRPNTSVGIVRKEEFLAQRGAKK